MAGMDKQILDYLALLRDFGRIYTQRILSGDATQKSDLRLSQIKAMYAFRDTDRLSAQELADMVGTKLCTATALADSLEQEGIVTRQRDAVDRRKVMISLTGKGKKCRREFLAQRHRIARTIFAHISADEQARLQQALCTVCEILQHAFAPDKAGSGEKKKAGAAAAGSKRAPKKKTPGIEAA